MMLRIESFFGLNANIRPFSTPAPHPGPSPAELERGAHSYSSRDDLNVYCIKIQNQLPHSSFTIRNPALSFHPNLARTEIVGTPLQLCWGGAGGGVLGSAPSLAIIGK
jgi:hypothetical protein